MAEANAERREVNARIVYWGVEGAGKESNLRAIHAKLRPDHRGRLEAVPTSLDPTVCSYRLPIELGEIAGVRTRIQIVAVPGGPEQAPTRKQLLDRVDGVVFVVDARRARIDDNVAAFEELRTALGAYGRSLEEVPLVVQYNHQDESDPFVLEELHRKLDVRGAAAFEAKASDGTGVLPTLTTISKRVVRQLRENEGAAPAPGPLAQPPAPAPVTSPPPPVRDAPAPRDAITARAVAPQGGPTSLAPAPALPLATPEPLVIDDLEQAALDSDVELLDERDDAVARAQGLLDASWSELADDLDMDPELEEVPLGPTGVAGGWHVVNVGVPEIVGAATLQIPLVVADAVGRELRFRLTVSLDPLLDE